MKPFNRVESDARPSRTWLFRGKPGPSIEKAAERQGGVFDVFLVVNNAAKTLLGEARVIDYLPEQAGDVRVVTSEPLESVDDDCVRFRLYDVGAGERRVLHYQMAFRNVKLPRAVLEWADA